MSLRQGRECQEVRSAHSQGGGHGLGVSLVSSWSTWSPTPAPTPERGSPGGRQGRHGLQKVPECSLHMPLGTMSSLLALPSEGLVF